MYFGCWLHFKLILKIFANQTSSFHIQVFVICHVWNVSYMVLFILLPWDARIVCSSLETIFFIQTYIHAHSHDFGNTVTNLIPWVTKPSGWTFWISIFQCKFSWLYSFIHDQKDLTDKYGFCVYFESPYFNLNIFCHPRYQIYVAQMN